MNEELKSLLQEVLAVLQWGLREPKAGEAMPQANINQLVQAVRDAIASYDRPLGPLGVVLEGGMLSAVITDDDRLRGTEVRVIDYDVDGTAEHEMIPVP